jgi:HB1, ASXL, restriction endonuclease HTH domain
MTAVQQVEAEIAKKQAELAELEAALRVLLRLSGSGEKSGYIQGSVPLSNNVVRSSLAGRTIIQAAEIVLREHKNQPMHFRAIAQEALKRGYTGRATGDRDSVEHRTAQSFWASMYRSENFQQTGKGYFKLAEDKESG